MSSEGTAGEHTCEARNVYFYLREIKLLLLLFVNCLILNLIDDVCVLF